MTTTRTGYKWVGTRPVRHDGLDKVTGRARFGADFATAGMLQGAVLRSPHAHARILSIDLTKALRCSRCESNHHRRGPARPSRRTRHRRGRVVG